MLIGATDGTASLLSIGTHLDVPKSMVGRSPLKSVGLVKWREQTVGVPLLLVGNVSITKACSQSFFRSESFGNE